jgi:hypothetical protein
VRHSTIKWALSVSILSLSTLLIAQNSGTPPGGGGSTEPPKDTNPANPSNWEMVTSRTGLITAVSYPPPFVTPETKTQNLALLDPVVSEIQSWGVYSAYWDLPNGVRNFRLKWIGLGPAPSSVRVLNKGSLLAHFTGAFDLTQSFTGLDTIWDASTSVDHILRGEDYKNVSVDTLYQIGFKMKGTISGDGASGHFSHDVSSVLAELACALRNQNGTTYHKLGEGPNKEENIGEGYNNWVMDIAVPQPDIAPSISLVNMLTGPWDTNNISYTWSPSSNFQQSLLQKVVQFPSYSPSAWAALSDSPDEKTVTVTVKDLASPDHPERTATIRIRLHNPDENWRKVLYSDGTPYESDYDKDPVFTQMIGETSSVVNGNEAKIKFRCYWSYPVVTRMNETINEKIPLIQALLNYSPAKFTKLMGLAQIGMDQITKPEVGEYFEASFEGQINNEHSEFHPEGRDLDDYRMTAGARFPFKKTNWKSDSYDETGYNGVNGGYTDVYQGGGYAFGIYTAGSGTGGPNGGNTGGNGNGGVPPPGSGSSGGGG